ncbi:MAG: GspE/PulE family protein [Deltaproteobacteria bacterium]|nr:GspE/PulE family protein [Deltaproteobacteria bacterium]
MKDQDQISGLQEILRLQKGLQDITNSIHAAQNIKQGILDTRAKIIELFKVVSADIYVVDFLKNDIYTVMADGNWQKEIRIPIDNHTIPGFVANTGSVVNIANAYDEQELKSVHREIIPYPGPDERAGTQTVQVMAMPILHNDELMGVIQVMNKLGQSEKFTDEEPILLQEIAEAFGIAFDNQQRDPKRGKSKFVYLVTHDLISEEELSQAREEARKIKAPLESILMKRFNISKDDIGKSLGSFYKCRFVPFNSKTIIPSDLLTNLKREYLLRELWVPLEKSDGMINVIVDDPHNILKRDTIESLLRTKVVRYDVALTDDITKFINLFYQTDASESSFDDILGKLDVDGTSGDEAEDEETVKESDSAIIQLVNKIVNDAFSRNASDIHIEPDVTEKIVSVRFRIDGSCTFYQTLPYSYRAALVSRIKIMSNLDITIKRRPQDGKIKLKKPGGGEIELRVATVPTQGNVEDVVMRILAKGDTMPLGAMGMTKRNYGDLTAICEKPYGLILVVGPTGSGKTTTLHAALRHINTPDRKIWTAEDPVEVTQRGLRQVQVQPKIGFDFAAAMRAFLRADPDVIMVGEMRDYETAKTAIEASLTGHLVFSTLHTNSAPETITRLLDMGIDPLNFSDSLLGILAQRLVKTLCKKCKEAYHPTVDEYNELAKSYGVEPFEKLNIPYSKNRTLYRPKGCDACEKSGYKGRVGIHELLIGTEAIKKSVQQKASIEAMRDIAISEGMVTLFQDGLLKALQGLTDVKQIHRVCIK